MRRLGQAEVGAELREVVEQGDDAAVIGLEEGLEDQASKELGLGVDLRAEAMGVAAEGVGADGQGLPGHAQR